MHCRRKNICLNFCRKKLLIPVFSRGVTLKWWLNRRWRNYWESTIRRLVFCSSRTYMTASTYLLYLLLFCVYIIYHYHILSALWLPNGTLTFTHVSSFCYLYTNNLKSQTTECCWVGRNKTKLNDTNTLSWHTVSAGSLRGCLLHFCLYDIPSSSFFQISCTASHSNSADNLITDLL